MDVRHNLSLFRKSMRTSIRTRSLSPISAALRHRRQWLASLREGSTPLDFEIPWFNYSVIDFLSANLKKSSRIFEYGMGGSSMFFARRVGFLASVDNDALWFNKVRDKIATTELPDWSAKLIIPVLRSSSDVPVDPSDPKAYATHCPDLKHYSFKEYASEIDRYPDQHFDFILVDGRARPSCFMHAVPKLKPGGFIIWDNSEREHYQPVINAATDGVWKHYVACTPGLTHLTQTSVWAKSK